MQRLLMVLGMMIVVLVREGWSDPSRVDTVDDLLARLAQQGRQIKDFSASFVRYKHMAILTHPLEIRGRLYYRKHPRALLWENQHPNHTVTLLTNQKIVVYYPQLKQAQYWNLQRLAEKNKLAQGFNALTGLTTGATHLKEQYHISLSQHGSQLCLRLCPKSEQLKPYLQRIELYLDRNTLQPVGFTYLTPAGDEERLRFSKIRLNVGLNKHIFELHLPLDVEVLRED